MEPVYQRCDADLTREYKGLLRENTELRRMMALLQENWDLRHAIRDQENNARVLSPPPPPPPLPPRDRPVITAKSCAHCSKRGPSPPRARRSRRKEHGSGQRNKLQAENGNSTFPKELQRMFADYK